jgi:adenosylcobinamide amidohydrolase
MAQPFRKHNNRYESAVWPGLAFAYEKDHIAIGGAGMFGCFSSAVYNGGSSAADTFVNWKVPLSYRCDDPNADVRSFIAEREYPDISTMGLLTAAKLTHASIQLEADDHQRIAVCTTAGTGNAARAGMVRTAFPSYRPGTINTVLLIDGRMTQAAMINAVMTAVEAKTAALQELGITDPENGLAATGTTTDALIVGVNQNPAYIVLHEYAGTAASIGSAIGRLVYASVLESVATQNEN